MSYSVMDPGVTRITRSFSLSESRNMPRYDASDHIRSGSRRQGQISLDDLDGPVGWSGSSSLETQEDQTQHRGRRRLLHRRLAREASVTVRDGSDCIPVLLSSSPLASPVLVSPWSPCSTSEGGVMVNKNSNCSGSNTGVHPKLVPHYARDASLKRSLSFGTRSMHIGLDDEDDDRKDKHDDEDYEWNDSIERRLDRGRLAWIPSSAGPTLPLFHDASGRPRRLRRSQSVCGLGFDVEKTLLVPQPRSSIISTTTTPSTPLQATGLSRSLSTSGVPLKTHHSTPPRRQTRHTTLPLTHWSSPKLDHSPTLPPVHTSSEANTVPNTPSSTATPDSPVLVTPDSKDIVDTPRPILSSRTSPRVSLLHTRGCPRPPPSSPPPIAPLPSTPLTDPLGPVAPQRQSRASTVNTSFELTTTTAAAPLSNAEENEEKGHSENNSDQSPRDITDTGNEKSLMSLEQVQRVQAHGKCATNGVEVRSPAMYTD
ncbi:hypothetical protein BD324DRAFT_311987 [Kockovaella imperatae]|uniref:Uncharacterized protein n=1 Tax=Kockovaella imperatae TaxID=4999 RepID=A0A1Y1UM44_9TREE|nr:hypothetical protein BD324DRAFT_311987 [Kockovaella imperatae]ORX39120.1 hypothetical protein BD324DRAFT_311987 [Kockovaella imperatae]